MSLLITTFIKELGVWGISYRKLDLQVHLELPEIII